MRHIKAVNDPVQNALFDNATMDGCGWWMQDLDSSARRRLEENWQGIFPRSLLQLMPAEQLAPGFDPDFGRPTTELHAMAALAEAKVLRLPIAAPSNHRCLIRFRL